MVAKLRLAVLTAYDYEAALVRRCIQAQGRQTTPVGVLWQGARSHCQIVLLRCGMGPNRARQAATWLAASYRLQGMISVGFAGGLQPELHTGDAVLAQQIQACSSPSMHAPVTFTAPMTPDPSLLHLAEQAATATTFAFYGGALLSVDAVITEVTLKQHLGQLSGALAIDMEAYSIARIAEQQQLPFVSLKTVFDAHDDSLPLSITQCAASDGTLCANSLVYTLLRHPTQVAHLPRLRQKAKTAGQHLGDWLQQFLTLFMAQGGRSSQSCRH